LTKSDDSQVSQSRYAPWRRRLHEIIFEADTPLGKLFDVLLIGAICLSVTAVILESVAPIEAVWGTHLLVIEWIFTVLFTIEYVARLISVKRPQHYAASFYGVIDLLSVVPTYLSLFVAGTQVFLIIRVLRLLRLFRIFKMARYVREAHLLVSALRASRPKITVFVFFVVAVVVIVGAAMHMIEGGINRSFASIPDGIYWAIVTVTTVGFGDIVPVTAVGKFLACFLMMLGFGTIAIPTGIVSFELARQTASRLNTQSCPACSRGDHDDDAVFCKHCGEVLNPPEERPDP
jgi:voltage-gated potassium channel